MGHATYKDSRNIREKTGDYIHFHLQKKAFGLSIGQNKARQVGKPLTIYKKTFVGHLFTPPAWDEPFLNPALFLVYTKGAYPLLLLFSDLARQTIAAHIEQSRIILYLSAPYRRFNEVHAFIIFTEEKAGRRPIFW